MTDLNKEATRKVARENHAVAQLIRENNYNWFPLVELVTEGIDHRELARLLLVDYFELSAYLADDGVTACRKELREALYWLRRIYEVIDALAEAPKEEPDGQREPKGNSSCCGW